MSFALTSFKKDLLRFRQDIMAVVIWISIPLLIGGLITSLMGSNVRPNGVLLMVDQDQSFLSELVAGAYSAGELGELLSVEKVGLEDGTQRIEDGDASGLLVIPKGFGAALVNSEPVILTLRTNPSQTILPGIITNVTEILLDAGFYAHQLFGAEINLMKNMGDNPPDVLVAGLAVTMQNKIEAVAPQLFPPVIDIEIVEPPPQEPSTPLALLFLPGIILMAVMFSSNGVASDWWREREQGTLRRLVFAPGQLGSFILGKALAAAVIIGAVGGFTMILGYLFHGVSLSKLPSSLLWISLSGVALFSWFAVLQMSFSSQKTATVMSSMLVFPLLMAGGSFFPLAVMPGWIAAIGRASPNGFMADRLTTEVTAATSWSIPLADWLLVFVAATTGLAVCAWRLRSGFAKA
jgi:ABC-2 type transport system permease protein